MDWFCCLVAHGNTIRINPSTNALMVYNAFYKEVIEEVLFLAARAEASGAPGFRGPIS
jgi:hypothetical protein